MVYDAVKWHVLSQQKVPLSKATIHFIVVMNWLRQKNLLTDAGKAARIDMQFELSSELLTPLGNAVLSRVYNLWKQQVDYKNKPNTNILQKTYNFLRTKPTTNVPDVINQQNIATHETNPSTTKTSTLEQKLYKSLKILLQELEALKRFKN